MKSRTIFFLSLFLLTSLFICQIIIAAEKTLLVGTSKVTITPEKPIPMAGFSSRVEPFKGVHDDLFARILVLSDGEKKAAIISADIIGFSESLWKEITEDISKKTGIQSNYILYVCNAYAQRAK